MCLNPDYVDPVKWAKDHAGRAVEEELARVYGGGFKGRVAGWLDVGPLGQLVLVQLEAEDAEVCAGVGAAGGTLQEYQAVGAVHLVAVTFGWGGGNWYYHVDPKRLVLV